MPMMGLLDADISFPAFTGQESESEKTEKILNYLYMLIENLRYTLGNLDEENFSEGGIEEIGKIISKPLYIRLEGAEGKLSELSMTAASLSLSVRDNANSISKIYTDINSISLSVTNYGSTSEITLTGNGIKAESQTIKFTGFVTFSDLSGSGTTTINGDNVVSGTITGTTFKSVYNGGTRGSFQCFFYEDFAGEIYSWYNTPSSGVITPAIYIDASGYNSALKLKSKGGTSIESEANIYIESGSRGEAESITLRSGYQLNLQAADSYNNITVGYVDLYGYTNSITLKEYIKGVVAGTL